MMADTIYDYDGFDKDIKEAFNSVMSDYGFALKKVFDGEYELRNGRCIIRLLYDRGDVSCLLKDPQNAKDTFGTYCNLILDYLYPDQIVHKEMEYDPKRQLKDAAEICGKLENVLNGDFSWLDEYIRYQRLNTAMFKYVREELDKDHPIYLQLAAGDPDWLKNMEQYVFINHIDLTDYIR